MPRFGRRARDSASFRERFDTIVTASLVVAALAMAALFLHREFVAVRPPVIGTLAGEPEYVDDWEDLVATGRVIGDPAAPILVVEFTDLECPFCARFRQEFRGLKERYGDDLALVVHHFPLPMHRFAEPAAYASECAASQDRFDGFLDVVFQKQDSLGLKSWNSYAHDAGVADTLAFAACLEDPDPARVVELGRELGTRVGVTGTPTLIVNGWRLHLGSFDELSDYFDDAAEGIGVFSSPPAR